MSPAVVMRPILWASSSVNQSAPSVPAVVPLGELVGRRHGVLADGNLLRQRNRL